jgi:hypothetical protein
VHSDGQIREANENYNATGEKLTDPVHTYLRDACVCKRFEFDFFGELISF